MNKLTKKEIGYLNNINTETDKMKFGKRIDEFVKALEGAGGIGEKGPTGDQGPVGDKGPTGDMGPLGLVAVTGTPVNAISAFALLEIGGVVKHGETVSIHNPEEGETPDIYEFVADAALSAAEGNIPVDLNSVTVKAAGELTLDTNPTSGDTMTIAGKVYTFVPNNTASGDGQINRASSLGATRTNVIAAIQGDEHNTPNVLAICGNEFNADILPIYARIGGTAGNTIDTTSSFTAGTNGFGAANLALGEDCTAANAATKLAAEIVAEDTQNVTAEVVDTTKVKITALHGGDISNTITVAETMPNAAFAAAAEALAGGVDGTPGEPGEVQIDSSFLYICLAGNEVTQKNWRRISLGTAY